MSEPVLWEHMLTGHPNQVVGSLCRSVAGYAREYSRFYVGRTQEPWSRMAAHEKTWAGEKHTLRHMILIYKTSSFAHMVKVEAEIIEHIKSEVRPYRDRKVVLNQKHGDWQESVAFYLYMLVDDGSKKKSISKDVDWDQMIHRGLATNKMGDIRALVRKNAKKDEDKDEDHAFVYIGFTDDPERRFTEHQRLYEEEASWSKMIVLYEGSNLHDTYLAEDLLIHYALRKYGSDMCLNASLKHETHARQPFFVYVLVGD